MPKISELAAVTTLDDADVIPIVNGGTTKKVTLAQLFAAYLESTVSGHVSVISPASYATSAAPTVTVNNALATLAFTIDTDNAFALFRIPDTFDGSAGCHVHWTKSGNADESTKKVAWRVSYEVFNGSSADAAGTPTSFDIEDTYDDSGTTTRIVYATASTELTGFVAGSYVAMKITAITPSGSAMASEPALLSVDVTFDQTVFG